MAISPLDLARKVISTTLSKAKINTTTPTTTKTSSNTGSPTKSPSTSNPIKSSGSYAYDPKGNKVNVTIKDGQSYLDNGQRVGSGYTVQTGGGIYKMGDDGKGVKVDSHNQYVSNLVNNAGNTTSVKTTNKDKGDIANTLSGGLDARQNNKFNNPMSDYTDQYNNALLNIYENNKVDNSVLAQMFTTDILQRNNPEYKRYGNFEITQEMIDGYDKAYDDTINRMSKKYDGMKDDDKNNIVGQLYADAINRYKAGGSKGNPNLRVQANAADLPKNTQYNNLATTLAKSNPPDVQGNVAPVNTVAPNANASTVKTNDFIPLDINKPDAGGIYQTNQGYVFEYEGEKTMISEQEYIELMETILGF